jgi:hypothetical protein
MGPGGLHDVNLDEARERHRNARQLLKKDKVDHRKTKTDFNIRVYGVAGGAAIRKQHHPAPLLFDASHPAIELPSEQTITGTDYQQSQSLG